MIKDSFIAQRAKDILRADRLLLMREHADQQATYCYFASMSEVAYHIHRDKMPPRYKEAEELWLTWGMDMGDQTGGVSPDKVYDLTLKLADLLEIKVEKIFANPGVVPHFLKDKVAEANAEANNEEAESTSENESSNDKTEYSSHAESQTFLKTSSVRIDTAINNGWEVALIISFSKEPYKEANNTSQPVPIELVANQTITVNIPYMIVMVKEQTTNSGTGI